MNDTGTLVYSGTHGHYVQGVAWDPLGMFLVSSSCDRSAQLHRSTASLAPTAAGAATGSGGE